MAGNNAHNFRDEFKGFKRKYPFITVKALTADTGDTINRSSAEAKADKLSLDLPAISSDGLELLAKAIFVDKMEFPRLKDFAEGTKPRSGIYVQAFFNSRVQGLYNTKIIKPSEAPKSWEDMVDPKWTGKTMLSRSSEDLPAQLTYLWAKGGKLNWERAFDLFRKL